MRTAYCPKTHRELARTSVGTEYGHVPGHQYRDVDVVISQSRDNRFRCHIVESWGSAQGYDEEHGRIEAIGRGESIIEAARQAKAIGSETAMHLRYLAQAVAKAVDEATEADDASNPVATAITPDNSGASQLACNIVNNTFLSLDGFEAMRKQMRGTDYTAEHFGAELARIVDRETSELLTALASLDSMFDNDSPLLTVYANEIKAVRAAIAKATGNNDGKGVEVDNRCVHHKDGDPNNNDLDNLEIREHADASDELLSSPPVIQAIDRTTKDGSCTLVGFFSDNAERKLFSFYIDELSFSNAELIGLTEEQAHQLRTQRDVAYLRS